MGNYISNSADYVLDSPIEYASISYMYNAGELQGSNTQYTGPTQQ